MHSINEIVKAKKDTKKVKYINEFNQYQHKYQTGVKKSEEEKEKTIYKGVIINDKTNKPIVDINKIKSLKQNTRKNVA